jgi:hypothetical protein
MCGTKIDYVEKINKLRIILVSLYSFSERFLKIKFNCDEHAIVGKLL